MKKWITFLLSAMLLFSLAACGSPSNESSQTEESMSEQQTESDAPLSEQQAESDSQPDESTESTEDMADTDILVTSGGSGIRTATAHLRELSTDTNWLEGHRFQSGASEDDIREWLDDIGILN